MARKGRLKTLEGVWGPLFCMGRIENLAVATELLMPDAEPSRDEAFSLLTEYNQNDGLIKHALAVEAVIRYLGEKRGGGGEKGGGVGLGHGFD